MSLPFWDPTAEDDRGLAPGITSLVPPVLSAYPNELSVWDVITLDGVRAPGIVRLEGGRHVGLDIKKVIAQLVPDSTILNFDPVPFTMTLTIWTPGQWEELQQLVDRILPKPGPNPIARAVRAEHPALALYGMSTVYFQAGMFPRNIGKGIVEVEFNAYEFNPNIKIAPKDYASPLPQGNTPGATTPTNTVTPPSQAPIPP